MLLHCCMQRIESRKTVNVICNACTFSSMASQYVCRGRDLFLLATKQQVNKATAVLTINRVHPKSISCLKCLTVENRWVTVYQTAFSKQVSLTPAVINT